VLAEMTFGEYLKKARKRQNLTQEYLAEALKVSNTYIHQLETGKIDAPNFERCSQLALALKVDVHDLWSLSRKERLEKYAERAGVTLKELSDEIGSGVDGIELNLTEQALVRLFRKLDPQTKQEFNGLIAMLFRHYPEPEIQKELQNYLQTA
jgi:transcriptional regulator with XRE-family HTH domain